ncbi:hypothetical protein SNOG_09465 [Parastagonospora nodorum SN15]|uniref:Uncharacterized protein n=1 Tax=Phaeosphaeria nodorum (strain SN15 / ATCC MYA-4574 / FGSC 10173) TaxID=321614 RepID=Q0UFJ9_PHANO|nr:hypothetical protein SNOG_09465 [Parastagonospora nodorum SN15]EAT82730.1 hypothetical protein SNOG_09465 [Parastagonospora nodorum SN15]
MCVNPAVARSAQSESQSWPEIHFLVAREYLVAGEGFAIYTPK